MDGYVSHFVSGEASPEFGSWGENVGSWIAAKQNSRKFRAGNFLLVRYEDMIADPDAELTRIAHFLKIECPRERITRAVERSSADQMRRLEQSQSHLWSSTRNTDQSKPFVRAARSGNWITEMPASCVRKIESCWGMLMKELGYELTSEKSMAEDHALETDNADARRNDRAHTVNHAIVRETEHSPAS